MGVPIKSIYRSKSNRILKSKQIINEHIFQGVRSVAVPGELKALAKAHSIYGKYGIYKSILYCIKIDFCFILCCKGICFSDRAFHKYV